jgi:hypothetical protein
MAKLAERMQINLMQSFSERIGAVTARKNIQIEGMDDALKNSLWNEIYLFYNNETPSPWQRVATTVARHVHKMPIDRVGGTSSKALEWFRYAFFEGPWYQTYEIIEHIYASENSMASAIASTLGDLTRHEHRVSLLKSRLNQVLERELSGYRFIDNILTPISSPIEVDAIETAIDGLRVEGHGGARQHLLTALELLGKKPDPDYRNSIKESISSIEAMVNRLAGTGGNGVDYALDRISAKSPIHGALKSAFKSLYGYSSNESGIRHSLLNESNIGYEEAAFMLVACSAFASYLTAKSSLLVDGE